MPQRSLLHRILPWNGGLNTALDSGLISDQDLTIADNVVFSTALSRLKREGMEYFGTALPAVTHRSSSGTTRTLVFASSINIASPLDQLLIVGEKITIASTGTGNDLTYAATDVAIATITTTTNTNDTITYTDTGSLNESSTATSTITVQRSSKYLAAHDYYYLDTSYVKQRYTVAASSQGWLFRYDDNGRRKRVVADINPVDTFVDGDVNTSTNAITLSAHTLRTGVKCTLTNSGGALPGGLAVSTNYYVIKVDANTIKLANSLDNALLENPIDITSAAGGGTHSLTPTLPTTITGPLDRCQLATFNNLLIWSMTGTGNVPKQWDPNVDDEYEDLWGNPPDFSFFREHQGSLITNDKTDLDRAHYSSPFNQWEWQGLGDSGAVDTDPGDGDEYGITAISPTFKGDLFITKRTKHYRVIGILGDHELRPMSKALGAESHLSMIPVDYDDLLYVSKRGFESIMDSDRYGEFEGQNLSKSIQATFSEFALNSLKYVQGEYLPSLNSAVWSVVENGETSPSALYFVNLSDRENPRWYRWPDVDCWSVGCRVVSGTKRLLIGTSDSRLMLAQRGTYTDFSSTAINYNIKSGTIYPGNDPRGLKRFLSLGFYYRPSGQFTFTVNLKVDGLPTQSYTFSETSTGDLLGTSFTLGSSELGYAKPFGPYVIGIEGIGRGLTIEITNNDTGELVELYGLEIEYEPVGPVQENGAET
jgi:hypothetical protein